MDNSPSAAALDALVSLRVLHLVEDWLHDHDVTEPGQAARLMFGAGRITVGLFDQGETTMLAVSLDHERILALPWVDIAGELDPDRDVLAQLDFEGEPDG